MFFWTLALKYIKNVKRSLFVVLSHKPCYDAYGNTMYESTKLLFYSGFGVLTQDGLSRELRHRFL